VTTVLVASWLVAISSGAAAVTIDLAPVKDNTLYEIPADTVEISNGAGAYMFVGNAARGDSRRALIAFDLSTIPAQSTITNAVLTLYMSRTVVGATDVGVHRVAADWGEGASNASSNEGRGAGAEPGDATWFNRFFPGDAWSSAGGDLVGTASATTSVAGIGAYAWSGEQLVADVQAWVGDPSSNYGWILIGAEQTTPSAKRFNTRENSVADQRPVLTIEYSTPVPTQESTWGRIKSLYR
jgi:hypothetical protein